MSQRHILRSLMLIAVATASFGLAGCGASPLATEVGDAAPVDETTSALDAKEDRGATDLTAAQRKAALFQLNQICGDTWCSGDWSFTFKKLTCKLDAGSCTWTALIEPSVPVAKPVPVYWRSCKVTGLRSFADLVSTAPNGYQSINQTYYMASTDCVQQIEPKLPPYTPLP
ncbi:MAG: hypothetical protein JWN44_1144 [Myxococcales bacterium]|nr:hypothetical protein [Myxococcales bacterium]